MNQPQMAQFGIGRDWSRNSEPLFLDPEAPDTPEFIRNAVLSGSIRVIPAGHGKVAILPMVDLPRPVSGR